MLVAAAAACAHFHLNQITKWVVYEEVVQKGSQVMKSNSYGLLALFFIYELFIISYLN